MSSFNARTGLLELDDGRLTLCVGKKRSGKSVLAKLLYLSYPGDKMVIDVAGDDGPPGDFEISGPVGSLPPEWDWVKRNDDGNKVPVSVRYVPDPGSPTFDEDIDHVLGLAVRHGMQLRKEGLKSTVGVLIHEIGRVAPVHRTGANMKRILEHNRHYGISCFMCGPRPAAIDTLVIQQADVIYVFELQNADDRERIAKNIGWDVRDFSDLVLSLGPHEYVRFDANALQPVRGETDRRLISYPALPESVVRRVL